MPNAGLRWMFRNDCPTKRLRLFQLAGLLVLEHEVDRFLKRHWLLLGTVLSSNARALDHKTLAQNQNALGAAHILYSRFSGWNSTTVAAVFATVLVTRRAWRAPVISSFV
jgi:hypothetical protein